MIINEEKVHERIRELEDFLDNFPDSTMAPSVRKELEYLLSLID